MAMLNFSGEQVRTSGRHLEWLEADGLGGFAMGTVSGIRTRRYHGLLTTATQPPAGRMLLVNGVNVSLESDHSTIRLSPQEYLPGSPDENYGEWVESFSLNPWPRWVYQISESFRIIQEVFVPHGSSSVVLSWRLDGVLPERTILRVRPLLTGRDFHALHRENTTGEFSAETQGQTTTWHPYAGVPKIGGISNGRYQAEFYWYRNFFYSEEQARGLDAVEDAASPGSFEFTDWSVPAILIFQADPTPMEEKSLVETYHGLVAGELLRRENLGGSLEQAADAYLVRRGAGKTIIAGYPWFGDWGRDTFIALRGICLSTNRWPEAHSILLEWAGAVSRGMLPNRFPDHGEEPEYNSVDAALWYILACAEYFQVAPAQSGSKFGQDLERMRSAIRQILLGYSQGTRFGIRLDDDGLLACGQSGVQLTWMDAKVGDWVVTPRVGKPVEIQALWLNALLIGSQRDAVWKQLYDKGLAAFRQRFWNAEKSCLFDVVDDGHQPGINDGSLRPNQIFAAGGLPINLLDPEQSRLVVDKVEQSLWTSMGLRSLGPDEVGYRPIYTGGVLERDGAYHQGTVWPWLAGPFIQAWVRAHGDDAEARQQARVRFLEPLLEKLNIAGLGHLSEIADADSPHTPRGCPFQAWSVGELLRMDRFLG